MQLQKCFIRYTWIVIGFGMNIESKSHVLRSVNLWYFFTAYSLFLVYEHNIKVRLLHFALKKLYLKIGYMKCLFAPSA